MIQILESKTTDTVEKYWYSLSCDEGDTKPTGEFPANSGKTIADGSRLFETGTEIRYELQSGEWVAIGQVDVPAPILISKTITENDTYNPADDNADGYSSVTVNVSGGGGETFEVEMSISQDRESSTATYSSNKTFTEVMSAADNGDTVQVNLTYTQDGSAVPADVLQSGKYTLSGQDIFVMLIFLSAGMYSTFAIALWAGNSENILAESSTIPMFTLGLDG